MAKPAKVRTASGTWADLAPAVADLSNYSTTTQMNTAITANAGLNLLNTTTASSASTVTVDNIFTSTYANYLILISITASARGELRSYLRSGGVDTTLPYETAYIQRPNSGLTSYLGQPGFIPITLLETTHTGASLTLLNPQVSGRTDALYSGTGLSTGVANNFQTGGTVIDVATQFDGIKIYPSTGTISGTIKIYGYK